VSAPEKIFLWDAGAASGTAGSAEGAFEAAAGYLPGGAEVTVREAEVDLMPAGGGLSSAHVPTGRKWRGELVAGEPSWVLVADQAAQALDGAPASS